MGGACFPERPFCEQEWAEGLSVVGFRVSGCAMVEGWGVRHLWFSGPGASKLAALGNVGLDLEFGASMISIIPATRNVV